MDESVVVSTSWLQHRLDDPAVRVVDVRDEWEFDGIGHVPTAVNVPFDRFRDDGDAAPGTLPGADAFAALLEGAGIGENDTIVAYDDTHGVFAARFLFTAFVYGHEDARLLDGDYSAWSREYETTTESQSVEPTSYDVTPLADSRSPLIDRRGVEAALERDAVFVDTRERDEFADGHLPGAIRLDWREAVDDDRRGLKAEADLEALFTDHGITPDREIVLYCNTARRISHTFVVLRALGYENVAFYEGSLTEWLAHGGDLETGPAPERAIDD